MKKSVVLSLGVALLATWALTAHPLAQRGQQPEQNQQAPQQGQRGGGGGRGRGQGPAQGTPEQGVQGVRVVKIRANVYMLAGAGANVVIQLPPANAAAIPAADAGLLVVDTGATAMNDRLIAAIRPLAGNQALRFVFNTSISPDHSGGNEALVKALGPQGGRGRAGTTLIAAHENVLLRMAKAKAPVLAQPTDTFLDQKELYFNDEGIQAFHVDNAHTDSDSVVFLRRSDVIATGEIFSTTTYPIIQVENGGSIDGVIAGLNLILDLAIPATYEQGGTMIVPGHGRLCDEADVVEYRNMVVIIRDRIQDLVKRGMTLDQVKATKPTLDYDRRYGAGDGAWTTDKFVEAAYKSLSGKNGKLG